MPEKTISLTHAEARERARLLRIEQTTLDLELTADDPGFRSATTITFACTEPGAASFLDFAGSELESVTLNGRQLDPGSWRDGRIPLPGLAAHNTVTVLATMAYSDDGEGLHKHVDPVDGNTYLYAMSFLNAGPRWFACFDQPDLKSRYVLTVQAPDAWTVLGNGPSSSLGSGRWRIEPTAPLSTYFVTLVAGPYASVHDEHVSDGVRIPLGLHVRASLGAELRAEAADLFEVTKASFDYYHRVFGVRYPFGEYHQAFVPDFNAGAMENPGCVTLRDQFIYRGRATAAERASRAGVVSHEMAHMWFGDLVTMTWWDDLWLNESFAEYMAHRCCTEVTRYPLWTEFGILRKDWGFQADQAPSTHPVAGNGAPDAASALHDFDGISYAKGAAVLRQLAAHLGDEVFFGGLVRHFETHRYANATFADLIDAWTAAGARDLENWAKAWLRTSGLDTLTADGRRLMRGGTNPGTVNAEPRPHTVAVAGFDGDGNEWGRATVTITDDAEVAAELPGADELALVVADAADETWAKIRFDRPWPQVLGVAPAVTDPATRVVLANALRDAVRDAELDPRLGLAGTLDLVRTETSPAADVVIAALLQFATDSLVGAYLPPAERPAALRAIRATAGEVLTGADPGSDRQLTAYRAAVRSALDPAELRAWLAADELPPGLSLDPELAWSIVIRLAVLTGDAEVIEEQTRRDPSAAGRLHAAEARAALADPAAKQAAWDVVMQPGDLSAYELYATASGFFQPTQHDLCEPYAHRYFDDVVATGQFRTGWSLAQSALLAYPYPHTDPEISARAQRCLSQESLESGLRRSLVDRTDALQRAVLARSRFF